MATSASLSGARILVVEDEMIVSMLIEEVLSDEQCVVVGPFDRVSGGLEAARTEALDLAVLDVNVAGTKIYPVADILVERGVPFLLLSGYGQNAVPPEHPDWRVCCKPFRPEDLVSMLLEQLKSGRQ